MADFEWDAAKAAENERKHEVAFSEAATVFEDPVAVVRGDEWHSEHEERHIATGRSAAYRLLTAGHTMRGDRTRIASARPEEDAYE